MGENLRAQLEASFAESRDAAPPAAAPSSMEKELFESFRQDMKATGRTALTSRGRPSTRQKAPEPEARRPHVAKPSVSEPELTWGETAVGAAKSIFPSTGEAIKGTAEAVLHPQETLRGLSQLGRGAVSQVTGAVGMKQDPTRKAHDEGLIRALEDHYKETYGSVKGFKKALATDPASVLLDASTVLGGVGLAAKGTKLGSFAAKASNLVDPVQTAVKVARGVASVPLKAVPYIQSFQTGKSVQALEKAAEVGAKADPQMREVFHTYLRGRGNPTDITDAAESALNALSKARGEQYVDDITRLKGGNLPAIPWEPVEKALKANASETMFKDRRVINKEAANALKEIADEVDWYRSQPIGDPAHTIEGFDALKRRVGDIRNTYRNDPVAYQKSTAMYNAVLDAIKNQHTDYAQIMENYSKNSDLMRQIGISFGLGKKGKASKETILGKLNRAGHKEFGQDFISELAKYEPALPYMMAGHELSQLMPGGLRGAISAAGAYAAHPVAGIAGIAAMSPRLSGELNYAAGRVGKGIGALTSPAATKGAYYAGELPKGGVPALAEAETGQEDVGLTDYDLRQMLSGDGDVWGRMINQESGGQQFDESGSPLTSSAGAIGTAQVMPETGPEAAKLAGEEWSLERLKTDPEYNLKLGRAYYEAQLAKFGDPFLAAAAYNAGPNAVDRALRKAEETGRPWLEFVPGETRDYVRIVSRGKFASGGKVGDDIEHHVQRLMSMVKNAKKAETTNTKPLLGSTDEAVARALKVAQEAI